MKNNFFLPLVVLLLCEISFSQKGEVFVKSELPIIKTVYNKTIDALFFNKHNKNEIHLSSFNNNYSAIFNGLGFAVLDYDVSQNGKSLVTANQDGSIIIWQVKPKKMLFKFEPNQGTLQGIHFYDDDSFLSLGRNGKLKKWDMMGRLVYEIQVSDIGLNAISKFDHKIVVGGYDKRVRIIDDKTKKVEFEINVGEVITSILVHKEQNIIYAGGNKGTLYAINIQSKIIEKIDLHDSVITDICIIKNKYLATSSWDKMIKFTEIEGYKTGKVFSGHKDYVFSLTLRNDQLFSSSRDKRIRKWNIEN